MRYRSMDYLKYRKLHHLEFSIINRYIGPLWVIIFTVLIKLMLYQIILLRIFFILILYQLTNFLRFYVNQTEKKLFAITLIG